MSNPTILIVEDEAIISADIVNKLGKLGYAVAGSTAIREEAVEIARRLRLSLILMDIRLAGEMDGITALDTIRKVCQLPAIFLTAQFEKTTLERAGQVKKGISIIAMSNNDDTVSIWDGLIAKQYKL